MAESVYDLNSYRKTNGLSLDTDMMLMYGLKGYDETLVAELTDVVMRAMLDEEIIPETAVMDRLYQAKEIRETTA